MGWPSSYSVLRNPGPTQKLQLAPCWPCRRQWRSWGGKLGGHGWPAWWFLQLFKVLQHVTIAVYIIVYIRNSIYITCDIHILCRHMKGHVHPEKKGLHCAVVLGFPDFEVGWPCPHTKFRLHAYDHGDMLSQVWWGTLGGSISDTNMLVFHSSCLLEL